MDRPIVYTQEQGRSTDFLFGQRAGMIGMAKLSESLFGAASPIIYGLPVTPTSPATLTVNVGIGQIYAAEPVDATAYGVLPADTTDTIVKQGLLMAVQNLACPAPTTAGYSINYLIQATYQDSDTANVVLPYFNSANPSQPISGQNGGGAAQATQRQGLCVVAVKAGAAAATGTQTTPAADAGYTGIAVVTVANGQASVTAPNIVKVAGAPVLPSALMGAIQNGALNYGIDTGAANACSVTYAPAITALIDGMVLWFKAAATNTGATTLNVNGLGASPVVGAAHSALQGGEIVANGRCMVVWNATLTSWVLIECTGGALQVAPATQSNQAMNLGQFASSITGNGYQKFPSGLILQWGDAAATTTGTAVSFPIAFPSNIWAVLSGQNNGGTQTTTATSVSLSGFTMTSSINSYNYWIALGK